MTGLAEKIKSIIVVKGPIPFRDFMEMALYDPNDGYYCKAREIGRRGDYYTSANIHPVFGEILADKFVALFQTLGDDGDWSLVEVGGGTGLLLSDILTSWERLQPDILERVTVISIEQNPGFREIQHNRLKEWRGVCWESLDSLPSGSIRGVVFSNELFDALPVHRLIFAREGFKEIWVDWRYNRFVFSEGDLSDPALLEIISGWDLDLDQGQVIEVNLDAARLLRKLAGLLARGYLVTIDYGDERIRLMSPTRREGTLRCFFRHQVTDNPLERVGEQDITTDVDFTFLVEVGGEVGLESIEFRRQRDFMVREGLLDRIMKHDEISGVSLQSTLERLRLKHFLMPGALGDRFKVLIQRKGYG